MYCFLVLQALGIARDNILWHQNKHHTPLPSGKRREEREDHMPNQTESYIILKPIAERFSRIANEITDEEIRTLIKSELSQQLRNINFSGWVGDTLGEWISDNEDAIKKLALESLTSKLR
jgi:hypothetical protein